MHYDIFISTNDNKNNNFSPTDAEYKKLLFYINNNLNNLRICYDNSDDYSKRLYNIDNSEFIFIFIFNKNEYINKFDINIAKSLNKPIYIIPLNYCDIDEVCDPILKKYINKTTAKYEIERKWLISKKLFYKILIKSDLKLINKFNITQFYNNDGIRYRKEFNTFENNYRYTKCIKNKGCNNCSIGFAKYEIETEITKEMYEKEYENIFSKNKNICPVIKNRYILENIENGKTLELNKYMLGIYELYEVEIEYNSFDRVYEYSLDEFISIEDKSSIYEITDDGSFSNKKLMYIGKNSIFNKKFRKLKKKCNFFCKNSFSLIGEFNYENY